MIKNIVEYFKILLFAASVAPLTTSFFKSYPNKLILK
jgi:hypothetical protein